MDKFKRGFRSIFPVLFVLALAGFFVVGVYAASTIGTNMSTTGTMTVTPATDSATSVRFQNAAETNVFIADSTNLRVGVRGAPQTTFEVQGTASASYFLTGNTIQVGGYASVAYNRFGTTATTHAGTIDGSDDIMVGGGFEVNGSAAFDGFALFSAKASVTTDFEAGGYASATDVFVSRDLIVGAKISSSSAKYTAEFGGGNNTATVSLLFGGSSATSAGTCFQMKNTQGTWIYLRFVGTTSGSMQVNTSPCHE